MRLGRHDEKIRIVFSCGPNRPTLDDLKYLDRIFLSTDIAQPVRRFQHREVQDNAVNNRNAADKVAQAPVGEHRLLKHGTDRIRRHVNYFVGELAQERSRGIADRVGNESRDDPAAYHARLPDADEQAAPVRRN